MGTGRATDHAYPGDSKNSHLEQRTKAVLDDEAYLFGLADHLGSHRGRAEGAQVFVLIAFRQDQQELLANRHRAAAFRTIKFSGIEFPESFCFGGTPRRRGPPIYKRSVLHGLAFWELAQLFKNIVLVGKVVKEGLNSLWFFHLEKPDLLEDIFFQQI